MCYSFQTSLISYAIGMISGIIALCTNQILLGCLILSYIQIQLSEALIWKGIDRQDLKMNRIGTSMAKYLLAIHNIGIAIGILIVYGWKPSSLWPLFLSILFFLVVVWIYHVYPSSPYTFPMTSCPDKKCQNDQNRLIWTFPQSWYIVGFLLTLCLFFLYIRPLKSAIFISIFYIVSLFLGRLIFPKTMSSIWCFYSAITAPIVVCINFFIIRNL